MIRRLQQLLPALAVMMLIMGLWGCSSKVDVVETQRQLMKVDREFSDASVTTSTPEAFYQYLADDALQLAFNSEPLRGREAIRDDMFAGPEFVLEWEPTEAVVSQSGDLGYTWGTYEVRFEDAAGELQIGYGKYLNVWRKEADGSWKVIVDMGNPNPPPGEPATP